MYGNCEKIKDALLRGEIVVTGRRYGKTRALVQILLECPDAVLITHNQGMIDKIIKLLWKQLTNKRFPKNRVLVGKCGLKIDPKKKVFIDEYFWTEFNGPFFAAAGTAPKPITIIRPNENETKYIRENITHLPTDILKAEFLVD